MKILLAIIITATFSFGCAMLEGEQTTTDSGGGATAAPTRITNVPSTVYFDCDYGIGSDKRSIFSDYAVWSRNLSNCDGFSDVNTHTDSSGNIYLFGRTYDYLGRYIWELSKLSSDGKKQWSREISSNTHDYNYTENQLITDNIGNLYITTWSNSHHDENGNWVDRKEFIEKYSSNGIKQWRNEIPSVNGHHYNFRDRFNFDQNENVYVTTGEEYYDNNTYVYKTIINRYSKSGLELWTKEFIRDNSYYDGNQIIFDRIGNFYLQTREEYFDSDNNSLGHRKVLNQYNDSGVAQWSQPISHYNSYSCCSSYGDVILDKNNNVIISAQIGGYSDENGNWLAQKDVLRKYSSSGVELWNQELLMYGSYYSGGKIIVDDSGNIYLTGRTGTYDQYGNHLGNKNILKKYSSSGTELWNQEMSLIHDQHSQSSGGMYLIFDNNWNIYVNETAQYNLDNGSVSHKSVLTKYSNSGAEQWSVEQKAHEIFQDIPNNLHFWSHPVFDKNDNVYITTGLHCHSACADYSSTTQTHVTKYSSAGIEQWNHKYSDMSYGGVFTDNLGNVYIDEKLAYTDSMGHRATKSAYLLKLR